MSKNNYKLAFKYESMRRKYAEMHEYSKLKKMYSSKYQEIPDLNTQQLWNELNSKHSSNSKSNFMEKDKLKVVKNWISGSKKILNIGFGSANLEEVVLLNEKYDWTGIDISDESVLVAKQKYKNASFSLGDVRDLKFNDNTFDIVVMLEVLEHIPPRYTFMAFREINRVLKKNGKLILSIPLNEGLESLINSNKNPNAHVRDYSIKLVRAELDIAGFIYIRHKVFYAFNNLYMLKKILAYFFKGKWKPNGFLIESIKK